MTLRITLIVLIGATLLATMLLGGIATYVHATHKVAIEMQAAVAVGERIARNLADDLDAGVDPRRHLEHLVADFDGDRHLRAEVRDDANRMVLSSTPAPPAEHIPTWFMRLMLGAPLSREVELPDSFAARWSLRLVTDARNEVTEVWEDVLNTLGILFAFCVMILGLVYMTVGRALKPLEQLSVAFGEIGHRGYSDHLAERGPEELKHVYQGFNRMVDRLAGAETENRRLQNQMTRLQEEERAEIARDLHDEIGPLLFSADIDAATIQRIVANDPQGNVGQPIVRIREALSSIQKHVRGLLGRLRAGPRTDLGLAVALEGLISFWRARNPETVFNVSITPESFGEARDSTIFRIVQEGLSNAMKHGHPRHVLIDVSSDSSRIILSIEDDGTGLPDDFEAAGYGIRGMRERVSIAGGFIALSPGRNGSGVRVLAELPIRDPAAELLNTLEKAG